MTSILFRSLKIIAYCSNIYTVTILITTKKQVFFSFGKPAAIASLPVTLLIHFSLQKAKLECKSSARKKEKQWRIRKNKRPLKGCQQWTAPTEGPQGRPPMDDPHVRHQYDGLDLTSFDCHKIRSGQSKIDIFKIYSSRNYQIIFWKYFQFVIIFKIDICKSLFLNCFNLKTVKIWGTVIYILQNWLVSMKNNDFVIKAALVIWELMLYSILDISLPVAST